MRSLVFSWVLSKGLVLTVPKSCAVSLKGSSLSFLQKSTWLKFARLRTFQTCYHLISGKLWFVAFSLSEPLFLDSILSLLYADHVPLFVGLSSWSFMTVGPWLFPSEHLWLALTYDLGFFLMHLILLTLSWLTGLFVCCVVGMFHLAFNFLSIVFQLLGAKSCEVFFYSKLVALM